MIHVHMAELDPGSCRSPFADREALTATGAGGGMPERAADLEELEAVLAPSREQERRVGVALYGPAGSGKTELALQCGASFRRAGGTVVHLECSAKDTLFGCCRRLANDLGADLPESGLALETARERALERIRGSPGPRCIVLDDVDRLPGDVRRELLLDVVGVLDDAAPAVFVTSTPLALRNDLGGRELATMSDSERVLAPYDAADLRSIFDRRVRRAFNECAIGQDLVDGAVEAALDNGGDVGFGLELLAAAGEIAQQDDALPVTQGHLVRARERVAVEGVVELVEGLRPHHLLALRGLCALAAADETPARIGTVFTAYVDACAEAGEEPNTERSLQNYVRRLVETGLVDAEEVRTDTGGKFNRYELTRAQSAIAAALDKSGSDLCLGCVTGEYPYDIEGEQTDRDVQRPAVGHSSADD